MQPDSAAPGPALPVALLEMDERQHRIFAHLLEKRPDLASMYRMSFTLLSRPADPGDEPVRVSLICHSMREVMNRVLTMERSASETIQPPSKDLVRALPDLLSQYPNLALDADTDLIPLPSAVAKKFDDLVKTAVKEKKRIRDDVASLLTDDGNSTHLVVKRWMESRDFFARWAHFTDKPPDPAKLPSDTTIRDHVAVFDELFDAVITAFFTARRSIDDLLARINAPQEANHD